jgi:hypothetical protein
MIGSRTKSLVAVVVLAAGLAACANDGGVAGPQLRSSAASLGDGGIPQAVTLCKIGPAGSTATFSIAATGGVLSSGPTVTISATQEPDVEKCVEIWKSAEPKPDPDVFHSITVTETAMSAGTALDRIVAMSVDGDQEYLAPTNSVTVRANYESGAFIIFKNKVDDTPPPPPPGLAGCTPGFWRQSQHYAYWVAPYTPTTAFSTVFANAFPGQTLEQVVQNGGGGLNALGRHTVAALLNAASPEVDYGMTPAEVVAAFNAAFASGSFEAQKNIFEGYNERGCSVDKSGTTSSSGDAGGKGALAK